LGVIIKLMNILCFRYHNIYTSEGLTLHKLALQLQDRLNSNGFSKANMSGFDDYPNLNPPGIYFMENVPVWTVLSVAS
jgi:hypothetical protein